MIVFIYNTAVIKTVKLPFQLQFPQFSRKFNASLQYINLKYLSFIAILFLLLTNFLISNLHSNPETITINEILRNPFKSNLHEELGIQYLERNILASKREYLLAQNYLPAAENLSKVILGIENEPLDTWNNLVKQKEQIQQQIKYWQKVYQTNPDYDYAGKKLALLLIQLDQPQASLQIITKLRESNPNDPILTEITKLIEVNK